MSSVSDIVLSSAPLDEKLATFKTVIDDVIVNGAFEIMANTITLLLHKVGESNPITRPAISYIVDSLANVTDDQELEKLCAHTLSLMRNKIMYYGDDSEVHQAKEEYSQAAKILAEVDLDHISEVAARANLLLRITELYLADDDSVAASRYVLRAHRLIGQCANNTALLVRHKSSYAQVLDAERKFQDAALRYLSLSQMDCPDLISDTDQVIALQHAATCAILAGAGPSRSRVLALLYNDPRARALPNYAMLEAMHCNKIIGPEQQTQFRELLKPHQNADLAGGSTILQRAVLEHNMLAVSKLYQNISLSSLGKRLSISCEEAETVAALMIEQGRMHGIIDQVAQSIIFQDVVNIKCPLGSWDDQIQAFCSSLNSVADNVADQIAVGRAT